jgi:23S rRNA pseudouridine2605 synthase
LTAEQLEAARAERMRQNGHGAISIEDVRTWIEETGLCVFLPRSTQAGQSTLISATATPTFVEAVAGQRTTEPTLELIAAAEALLVRLEAEGVAVRLNLAGQPGDQPDYVVAGWVLPYIYALRGDRDWRRSPQLTGSRQVSPLAVQTAKQLDSANMSATQIRDALGREVTEAAVLRALHELWKQLRIIPVVPEVGTPALWQPLRQRFQKAIAEGASSSLVTAFSVLASIYLQAVIAASMEDVEMFLSPLTSRSKIREVVRGLAATRQVHTTTMGHSPMFYVAGTLPEFPAVPSFQIGTSLPSYRSSAYLASYLGHAHDHDDDLHEPAPGNGHLAARKTSDIALPASIAQHQNVELSLSARQDELSQELAAEPVAESRIRPSTISAKPQSSAKSATPRPRPARTAGAAHPRERSRTGLGSGESRSGTGGDRRRAPMPRSTAANGSNTRSASGPARPARNGSFSSNGNGNGAHPAKPASSVNAKNGHARGANGANGGSKPTHGSWAARQNGNGANGHSEKGAVARPGSRNGSPSAAGAKSRSASGYKSGPATGARGAKGSSPVRSGSHPASGQRTSADSSSRKPAASATKRYSFSGQAKQAPKPASKTVAHSGAKSHSKSAHPTASKRRG